MTLLTPKAVLEQHRVVICVGTGGVGKTTVSAAMALAAARAGRRTLVLTIDPARRLADALGIDALGNEPQRVSLPGPQSESLALHAMMLDPKRTFDGLIARFAPSEEVRRQILQNPIYQHVSGALSGSGEYAAMEKVLEMAESDDFDLVVVDTPPAQHVLEFIEDLGIPPSLVYRCEGMHICEFRPGYRHHFRRCVEFHSTRPKRYHRMDQG